MDDVRSDRLEREKTFHNTRFADETRIAQEKYYFALQKCDERMEQLVDVAAKGADVLEYGCGTSELSMQFARKAKTFTGIDISDVAIAHATTTAREMGLENVRFMTMDAEALEFPDGSFDLVFGTGILHHLDLERAYSEICRVLRPGGQAIFKEPLGHNAIMNAYRRMTPNARTVDEHPLLGSDLDRAKHFFPNMSCEFYGLTTLATVPFRDAPFGQSMYAAANGLDSLLTRIPGLRLQAWYSLLLLRR